MCAPLDLSAGPGKSNNTLAGPENRRSNRPLIPWSSIFGLATRIRISIGLKKSRLSKQPLHCTAYLNSESSNPWSYCGGGYIIGHLVPGGTLHSHMSTGTLISSWDWCCCRVLIGLSFSLGACIAQRGSPPKWDTVYL